MATITLDNLESHETVHQRVLLITGRCSDATANDDFIRFWVSDPEFVRTKFPEQRWPMCQGHFKALAVLEPGENVITFTAGHDPFATLQVSVMYVPLLQTPPLHLAILVAKDSPLIIDCPPSKFGSLSTAHSSLDAAIAKLRVTAYMWQALTAEEMRSNGLGRRTFRLEEEWGRDTLSSAFISGKRLQTTAKVHLIRSSKTVDELRHHQLAQQNSKASRPDELHAIFTEALLEHGAPFLKEASPVVAGMILDSHYDAGAKLITAHAALGAHDPRGLSLGIFGSHLTYSWPRFMEEVPDCLLDTEAPGDRVGNDNGECVSMWEACSVGQGAFLHEVGHAFSAPHSSGIMMRGYSKDWPKCFLSKTADSRQEKDTGITPVTQSTPNECRWDIRDLLRFRNLAHFSRPSDEFLDDEVPNVEIRDDGDFLGIAVTSAAGVARISFNGVAEAKPTLDSPIKSITWSLEEIEERFGSEKSLELEVVSLNGKQRTTDVRKLFTNGNTIRIPGTSIRLAKKSVTSNSSERDDFAWMVMLKKRGRDGSLVSVKKIDIRVGAGFDGVVVHYKDGSSAPCGRRNGSHPDWDMGGHQAKKIAIPSGEGIEKVAVCKGDSGWDLNGMRIFLSGGKAMGALNKSYGSTVKVLVPEEGHRIVGFYGTSGSYGMCKEFGIITASKNQEIPQSAYEFLEAQSHVQDKSRNTRNVRDNQSDDSDTSEDEDDGYDNMSDVDTIA
ncbi:peptidase family protein [Sarocladium implicatum]|nr:peptidase family protein [Sarocladium implicatum]